MFVERVPTYRYRLPCGAVFRSLTVSVHDGSVMKWHWFPCRRCRVVHAIRGKDLKVTPPRGSNALDEAIIKDRIVGDLRATWGSVTALELAVRHKVSEKTVYRIGQELGVWR